MTDDGYDDVEIFIISKFRKDALIWCSGLLLLNRKFLGITVTLGFF